MLGLGTQKIIDKTHRWNASFARDTGNFTWIVADQALYCFQ